MRKRICVITMVIFNCLAMFFFSCRESYNTKTIYSSSLSGKVQLKWNSAEFEDKESVVIFGKKVNSENRLSVFSRWDKDSLYLFFRVNDTDLRAYQTEQDHPKLFLDDMVEVLIDTRNDKDSCWNIDDIVYHLNLLQIKKDDRGTETCKTNPLWNGNARFNVLTFGTVNDTTDLDNGFLVSLSVPWSEIGQTPSAGLRMGINFANSDNDGKGRQLYDWVAAWPMRTPYAFGDLILTTQ